MHKKLKKGLCLVATCAAIVGMSLSLGTTGTIKTAEVKAEKSTVTKQTEQTKKNYKEGEAIVMYRDDAPKSSLASMGDGIETVDTYEFTDPYAGTDSAELASSGNVYVSLVKSDTLSTKQIIAELSKRSDVEKVEPNYIYKADGTDLSGYQWAYDNEGQFGGAEGFDVNPEAINSKSKKDGKEKVIAIVDTGVDYTHTDLEDQIWTNPYPSTKLKGEHGYDFANNDADPMDDNGHGTHCSGIMAGNHDGNGISGVSDSEDIKIMALKFLGEDGSGDSYGAIGAYNYIYRAQQLGTNVVAINNSWGGGGDSEDSIFAELVELVGEKGAVSVCAAGNSHVDNDLDAETGMQFSFPASIDSDYIISVASVTSNGELSSFSDYGAKTVDLGAPGSDILSSVSYYCFNPTIYTDDEKEATCSYFADFDTVENVADINVYRSIDDDDYENAVDISSDANFGLNASGKSLKWEIKAAESDGEYIIAIPFESMASANPLYASTMFKLSATGELDYSCSNAFWYGDDVCMVAICSATEDGKPDFTTAVDLGGAYGGNSWNHMSASYAKKQKKDEDKFIIFAVEAARNGDYTLYIDDVAISNPEATEDMFGKYDFYNGTSMATPCVTGAVAAIADAYPELDALGLKSTTLACTTKIPSLEGKCSTNGVLDLSVIENPRAVITRAQLNKAGDIEITGNFLNGATILINGKEVTPKSAEDKKIVVAGSDYTNRKLEIVVSKNGDEIVKNAYFAKGKDLTVGNKLNGYLVSDNFISDGTNIYNVNGVDEMQMVATGYYEPVYDGGAAVGDVDDISTQPVDDIPYQEEESWMGIYASPVIEDVFGKEFRTYVDAGFYTSSNLIANAKGIYALYKLDAGFTTEVALIAYTADAVWVKAGDVPEELKQLENVTLANYNGKIIALGGIDITNGELSKLVYSYDLNTQKWTKLSNLPEGRCSSQAYQVNGKLVVTLGAMDTEGTIPANLIYDGTKWTKSKASLENMDTSLDFKYLDIASEYSAYTELDLMYYYASVCPTATELYYVGNGADGLGNIFKYNVAKDSFETTGYVVPDKSTNGTYLGAAITGNTLTVFVDNKETNNTDRYTLDVQGTGISAYAMLDENVNMMDAYKTWMPWDEVVLTPDVYEGYYIKEFTVDGKEVKADKNGKYTFKALAATLKDGFEVVVTAKPFITTIDVPETITIAPGNSEMIFPDFYMDGLDNTDVTWTSSSKYVKVDEEGTVKVSKNAKPGLTATITITAKDANAVSATVTVKVPKLAKVGKTVTVNGVVYKVTKSTAKEKTVTVTGFSKKKKNSKSVIIDAAVGVNGYSYKVTAIAKDAFKSCSKLKTVTINSTSIKSIGKNAFAKIAKKATINVPKKSKKAYKKLLKKSGFKGTVK